MHRQRPDHTVLDAPDTIVTAGNREFRGSATMVESSLAPTGKWRQGVRIIPNGPHAAECAEDNRDRAATGIV